MDSGLFHDAMNMQRRFTRAQDRLDGSQQPAAEQKENPSTEVQGSSEKNMVYETENSYMIVLRVPWAQKEHVRVAYDLKRIEVKIETSTRKFHKMLNLPGYVIPHAGRATFTADILRIELPKYKNTLTVMSVEE